MEVANKYATLKTPIEGAPKESDFELKTSPLALLLDPGLDEMIVKNLYLSIDPYQLNRMKRYSKSQKAGPGFDGIILGEEIKAYGVAKVVASDNVGFEKGDLIVGVVTWAQSAVQLLKEKLGFDEAFKYREETDLNSTLKRLAVCGAISEYIDSEKRATPDMLDVIYKRTKIQGFLAGNHISLFQEFISIASDHLRSGELCPLEDISDGLDGIPFAFTGLFRGDNIGKKIEIEAYGVASDNVEFEKCDLVVGVVTWAEYRYSGLIAYAGFFEICKAQARYFLDRIDIYFDNGGAEMLKAVVANMIIYGRVAVCGVISEYTDAGKRAAPNMLDVIYKKIKIQGFLAWDHMGVFEDLISTIGDNLRSGNMHPL
ncbi:hypothetical protein NL676_035557 [Syzygium grande]|nr:hypothetical protein NL676_035557 [Syzygium grande]